MFVKLANLFVDSFIKPRAKALKGRAGGWPPLKKGLFLAGGLFLSFLLGFSVYVFFVLHSLPPAEQLKDYTPPLLTVVLDRNGQKMGEFFRERRFLTPYHELPNILVRAFVSAEDGRFFEHKGIHYQAIFRAFLANLRKGRKVQGGSTITQQAARLLLLSAEKTYTRKLKEAVLAVRMEKHLTKQEILSLYLNQIYLGHGAYGVGMASRLYFRKHPKDLTLSECALLAGLPKAPSRFSPIYNPRRAKQRQVYVLQRMVQENYIPPALAEQTIRRPIKIYLKEPPLSSPSAYYMETLRQMLAKHIGEDRLLTGGLTVKASMDHNLQALAEKHLKKGLKDIDKRQGFRGPLKHLNTQEDIQAFLQKQGQKLLAQKKEFFILKADAAQSLEQKAAQNTAQNAAQPGLAQAPSKAPPHLLEEELSLMEFQPGDILKGVVQKVSDVHKQVLVQLAFQKWGVIPLKNMKWARTPNPKISSQYTQLLKPSSALKKGDVIQVIAANPREDFKPLLSAPHKGSSILELSLDQEPLVEGAFIVFDQNTEDITALAGGYDFKRSQFNRAYQAARQTGSVFKPVVYLSALDKGFTPVDFITDSPVAYAEEEAEESKKPSPEEAAQAAKDPLKTQAKNLIDKWRPFNYSRRFSGDILFRNALIRSMNVPTVKVMERLGIKWVTAYARRLGIFHTLNPDYTLALGSSSVTLYEMTKVFSIIARLGKNITPFILQKVWFGDEELLGPLSLDERFLELTNLNQQIEEQRQAVLNTSPPPTDAKMPLPKNQPPFFFEDPQQVISPQTAFIMTNLLNSVIHEPGGTGYRARVLNRPAAGKTGTTNGYYDAWFIGGTPELMAGVWVGFDSEQSLGIGETGARAALPIWLSFMKEVYKEVYKDKTQKTDWPVPDGIVFTNIDNETGRLVSSRTTQVASQAFRENNSPVKALEDTEDEDQEFLREDLLE